MGVDDKVRDHTVFCKGHVFLLNQASNDTFLSVARGELVANFGDFVAADHHAHETAGVKGFSDIDVVNPALLAVADKHGGLTSLLSHQE